MLPTMLKLCRCSINSLARNRGKSIMKQRTLKLDAICKLNMHFSSSVHISQASGGSTVNLDEVDKFNRMAGEWWDEQGDARPLHAMNELRVPLIRDGLEATGALQAGQRHAARPLAPLRLLDVGCGGGLLAEPLARLGADVTGIDAAHDNIQVAEAHAACDSRLGSGGLSRPHYRCCTVEQLASEVDHAFDAVVASEVLEHVDNQRLFVDMCCHLLKPGGSLFITTLNRSRAAWLAGVVAAEYVFGVLPVGTHDWNKFIRPDELHALMADNGLTLRLQHGLCYNPVTCRWCWTADTSVNYAVHAMAPAA